MTIELTREENGVVRVSLDRADVRNAFNDAVIAALTDTFTDIGADPTVRAVILDGRGKVFSAGADLNWMRAAAHYSDGENKADAMRLSGMLDGLDRCTAPVIAVTHGAAMGGAVGLLACSDIVIAAQGCKFALSEVKLGLTPATISPYVVRAVGARWARRLFTTAEMFTTDLAQRIGLVHEVTDDLETAQTRASELASQIAANAPGAVRDAKRLAMDVAGQPITVELRQDTATRIAARRVSAEGREGLSAFLDKRPPVWPTGDDA